MARAEIGAVSFSKILISMAKSKKECIEKKNSLADIYKNLHSTLIDYQKSLKDNDEIEKDIVNLENDLEEAKQEEDTAQIKELEEKLNEAKSQLLYKQNMIKSIDETITALNSIEKDKDGNPKDLNSVLSERMKEIYKNQELCPYCLGSNPNCGFFNEESSGNSTENASKSGEKKDVFDDIDKNDYSEQDIEGKKLLDELKNKLKGQKVEIEAKDENGKKIKYEFDLEENFAIQYHHINSYVPYVETPTVSIAGNKHGFNINENSVAGSNCGLSNIIALPSIATNQGPKKNKIKVIKDGVVEYVSWGNLSKESKKKVIETYMKNLKDIIDEWKISENKELGVYKDVEIAPVHLGPHTAKLINAQDFLKDEMSKGNLKKDNLYSYEDCVYLKNAEIEEEIHNMINNNTYLCSNMEEAKNWYSKKNGRNNT